MLYFLHVGAFLLRFSHYSYSSQRGGGNSRQLSPLNKIRYLHGRLFAAFSLPFLHVRAFLLRFSHYNFAPAEGGGRASLGVRLSLKNEERNMFCYMRGLFATFFSMWFFLPRCSPWESLFAIFFYVGSLFCLYGGGAFFGLPLLLKLLLFIFVNKMLALKFILCRIPIVANCISTRVTLFFIPFDSNII